MIWRTEKIELLDVSQVGTNLILKSVFSVGGVLSVSCPQRRIADLSVIRRCDSGKIRLTSVKFRASLLLQKRFGAEQLGGRVCFLVLV